MKYLKIFEDYNPESKSYEETSSNVWYKMKYLKIFEDYSDFFYEEIPFDYFDSDDIKHVDISEYDIKSVSKLCNSLSFLAVLVRSHPIESSAIRIYPLNNVHPVARVSKIEDDYFLVTFYQSRTHYKCDQIEGLLECLEDELGSYGN